MKYFTSLAISLAALASTQTIANPTCEPIDPANTYTLLLIDSSGSMSTKSVNGGTRFQRAKNQAIKDVDGRVKQNANACFQAWTFSGNEYKNHSSRWLTADQVKTQIDSLSNVGGNTPLAKSLCASIDEFARLGTVRVYNKFLFLSSDGDENSTPSSDPCFGPSSKEKNLPYTPGSWQAKVYSKLTTPPVTIYNRIFTDYITLTINRLLPKNILAQMGRNESRNQTALPVGDTLIHFYRDIAKQTGGGTKMYIGSKEQPIPLPNVVGDLSGNGCIDDEDFAILSENFGQVDPQSPEADLDFNNIVNYDDFLLLEEARKKNPCPA